MATFSSIISTKAIAYVLAGSLTLAVVGSSWLNYHNNKKILEAMEHLTTADTKLEQAKSQLDSALVVLTNAQKKLDAATQNIQNSSRIVDDIQLSLRLLKISVDASNAIVATDVKNKNEFNQVMKEKVIEINKEIEVYKSKLKHQIP